MKPERDLRGKAFAVDLSLWLVQAASSPLLKAQHKHPHLFLTYSRATFFLRLGVRLVVVVARARDPRKRWRGGGDPSDGSLDARAALDARGAACVAVLRALGTPVVFAAGEAEATCAALDAAGLVDGVFTEDGDAFLCEATASEHTSNDEPSPPARRRRAVRRPPGFRVGRRERRRADPPRLGPALVAARRRRAGPLLRHGPRRRRAPRGAPGRGHVPRSVPPVSYTHLRAHET